MNCLLYIVSPTHVISAFSALKSLHRNESIAATVLVYWPGVSAGIVEEIGDIVRQITRGFSFVNKLVIIPHTEIESKHEYVGKHEVVKGLRMRIGRPQFQEIYYAHDAVGSMFQLLRYAYPDSRTICFGDALGNVYEKSVVLSLLSRGTQNPILKSLRKALGWICYRKMIPNKLCRELLDFKPHEASLILPVDQSGEFLNGMPLTVCSKKVVMEIIDKCILFSNELLEYINNINRLYTQDQRYLLLTENNAEGSFIDFDKEIEMYHSIITESCIPGSVIFLKSHPLETFPRNERIKERVGDLYEIVELDKKFKRYPIELWKELVQTCTVICMSYPILSLKYLYDIDVIQPMDKRFVERWFPQWTWASYENAVALYMEPLKRLPSWDGKSVLWSGCTK